MKCDFPKGEDTCRRCKNGGHVCIVEGRKRGGGAPKLVIPHVFMSYFFSSMIHPVRHLSVFFLEGGHDSVMTAKYGRMGERIPFKRSLRSNDEFSITSLDSFSLSFRCTLAVLLLQFPQLFLVLLHHLECLLQHRHLTFRPVLANENILWHRLGKKIL